MGGWWSGRGVGLGGGWVREDVNEELNKKNLFGWGGGSGRVWGGGGRVWGHGICERRSEVFVKMKKKNIFWGVRVGGGVVLGGGGGSG